MGTDLNFEDVRRFWILRTVVETGSVSAAARKLKVTTSAVSQNLANLEKNLGARALIRDKGHFRPTPRATEILATLEPAFLALRKVLDETRPSLPQMSWLTLGTYESLARSMVPGLMDSLKKQMPNLKLNVQIARSSTLLTRLRKGELCMAILAEVDGLEEFRTRVIYEDRMAVFARRDLVTSSVHSSGPSQGDESRRLLEALGVGVLAPGQEGHPRYMSQFLKTLPANVPVKVSSDSLEALAYCASQGSIAACLPVRVGTRSDLNLVEVPSITAASGKFSGSHKILLVSHKNCDSAEFEFLFREVSAV